MDAVRNVKNDCEGIKRKETCSLWIISLNHPGNTFFFLLFQYNEILFPLKILFINNIKLFLQKKLYWRQIKLTFKSLIKQLFTHIINFKLNKN